LYLEHALGLFAIKVFLTFGQQLAPQGCADSEVRCLLTSLQSVGGQSTMSILESKYKAVRSLTRSLFANLSAEDQMVQ
jgi:hypothetical protein